MMRRSFQFYDKEKQRSIGKKEMFSVMLALKMFDDNPEQTGILNDNLITNAFVGKLKNLLRHTNVLSNIK